MFFYNSSHPHDSKCFAFSLIYINNKWPHQRFQWNVLPQEMINSPTICQIYVDKALRLIRDKYPQVYISHYKDGILFSGPDKDLLEQILLQY